MSTSIMKILIRSVQLVLLNMLLLSQAQAQDTTLKSNVVPVEDLGDFGRRILHKKEDTAKAAKKSTTAILPSFGYNPSLGFLIGAKVAGVKQLGDPANTRLSAFGLEALLTSKGVITVQARHNVFKAANKWNIQGNWQFSKFLVADYNVGTGNKDYITKSDSTFPIKFNYFRFTEGVYRRIGKNFYAGAGVTFNIRTKIDDEKLETLHSTPLEFDRFRA